MKFRSVLALALALAFASPAAAQETRGISPLTGPKGGTNNAFMQFTGPAGSLKTYILPNVTGTSLAALNLIQTWSAAQSFPNGMMILLGSGSGSTTIEAPATGGGTAVFFTGSDTVVGIAAVQTLTNKTLTSPVINGATIGSSTIGSSTINSPTINTPTIVTPSISNPTVTGSFTATGLVTFADIATAALSTASQYQSGASNVVVPAAQIYQPEVPITFGTTTLIDLTTLTNGAITLTGNITTMNFTAVAGKAFQVRFIQDGTGSRTTVWNTILKFPGGTAPTLSAAAGAVDALEGNCVTTSYCVASLLLNVK